MTTKQQVFTLVVELGRGPDDGLPKGATGAALMCFASGVDEAEAVRETVAILKQADMAPLDVTGYGTLSERLEQGHEVGQDERDLMARALEENSVVVAQLTPFFDEAEADAALGRLDEADEGEEGPDESDAAAPAAKTTSRGARHRGAKTGAKPAPKPASKSGPRSGGKAPRKPGAKPGVKPAGKPGGKPRTR